MVVRIERLKDTKIGGELGGNIGVNIGEKIGPASSKPDLSLWGLHPVHEGYLCGVHQSNSGKQSMWCQMSPHLYLHFVPQILHIKKTLKEKINCINRGLDNTTHSVIWA